MDDHGGEVLVVADWLAGDEGESEQRPERGDEGQRSTVGEALQGVSTRGRDPALECHLARGRHPARVRPLACGESLRPRAS